MGLIMLVLIGTVPTAYALNRAVPDSEVPAFEQASNAVSKIIDAKAAGYNITGDPRPAVTALVRDKQIDEGTYPSLAVLIGDISNEVKSYGSLANIPADQVRNTRNDMYLVSEAMRNLPKIQDNELSPDEQKTLAKYKGLLDHSTKFIPTWVKICVALALGLGTMIGWKRIVVTVGEKIGKTHLTYGQGAAAEIVAMATIAAADQFGLPVSTPTSSRRASPAPWRPTARACRWRRSATSSWPGCSRYPARSFCRARSTSSSPTFSDLPPTDESPARREPGFCACSMAAPAAISEAAPRRRSVCRAFP